MENSGTDPKLRVVRTLQFIILTLAAGVLAFALIVFLLPQGGVKPWNAKAIVSQLMAGISVVMILSRVFVPPLIAQSGRQKIASGTWPAPGNGGGPDSPTTEEGKLLAIFQMQAILGSALLEGAAFCNLVAFLLEGQSYSLLLVLLLLSGILAGIPTVHSLEGWLEQQRRRMHETQDLAGLK
ncbi:MAG: hypothetical protein ACYC6N_08870 [Pirellulaceae bacterium]